MQEQRKCNETIKDIFDATETSVDHFANALGNNLTNAIRNGTATAEQLEQAIQIIGREALGTEADIEKLQRSLRSIDDGNSLQQVRNDLRDLSREAERASQFQRIRYWFRNILGGLMAGGISGAIEQALDTSKLKTKLTFLLKFQHPLKIGRRSGSWCKPMVLMWKKHWRVHVDNGH